MSAIVSLFWRANSSGGQLARPMQGFAPIVEFAAWREQTMTQFNILSVASTHSEWLALRRALVAGNVANANTPKYAARDVEPFSLEAANGAAGMNVTHSGHLPAEGTGRWMVSTGFAEATEPHHSGNNVKLDAEIMKAGEVARGQNINAGIVKAFYRLLTMSMKG